MNYLEFTKILSFTGKTACTVGKVTEEDVQLLNDILSINPMFMNDFLNTDHAPSFYSKYPDIKKVFGGVKCVDVFYALKLGHTYNGIPNRIPYLMNKAMTEVDASAFNSVLCALKNTGIFGDVYYDVDGTKVTNMDIIANVFRKRPQLITEDNLLVKYDSFAEVYVRNTDTIALLPLDIADSLSREDCEAINFDKTLGLVINNVPIRTLGNRLGVALDDYDLRDCL